MTCCHSSRTGSLPAACQRGFTLAEVLVVIGVVALLLALLLPALGRARASARAAHCASTMRNIGQAFHAYAQDNQGYVPRTYAPWKREYFPHWMLLAGPYLNPDLRWQRASSLEPENVRFGEQLLREFEGFRCPAHPLDGEIAGAFVVNAFKFESQPEWDPDGPVKLTKVNNTSGVVWIAEAADWFGTSDRLNGQNHVFIAETKHVWHPDHLPRAPMERISDDRHRGRANLLFFDMSVRPVTRGGMRLDMFDDGVTDRAMDTLLP